LERGLADDLRAGRPEALERLLAKHGQEIQAVAYLILRDRDDAADVLAETMITAWRRVGSLRDPDALRAWLLRIATNRALSRRRSEARIALLRVEPETSAREVSGSDLATLVTTRAALQAGLEVLPPRMRAAIALRYYADLPVAEVARALGTSENTVKTQLRTALARLRRTLDEQPAAGRGETRRA
jgi:RNA polymerase sigma-70 factor (ECF subfamily)